MTSVCSRSSGSSTCMRSLEGLDGLGLERAGWLIHGRLRAGLGSEPGGEHLDVQTWRGGLLQCRTRVLGQPTPTALGAGSPPGSVVVTL